MAAQLDILALEPFFGGARRAMLETLVRHSRHRWTLLKLPPRRIERRLAAAAQWFAEQLSRHWVGRINVLFTSEAMNLANLHRLVPALGRVPAVVYYHDNQLPPTDADPAADQPMHLVNLSTASAASEVWFNSLYHLRDFLTKATAMVERHAELAGRNPLPEITAKSQLMPPPIDFSLGAELVRNAGIQRSPRTIFIDTRDANVAMLNSALMMLLRRGEKYQLITVGPVEGLDDELPRRTISERDELEQVRALHEAGIQVSGRIGAAADHHGLRGLSVGCRPVWPNAGVYPELLPKPMHERCLYEASAGNLFNRLMDVWWMQPPESCEVELSQILQRHSAVDACRAMDERLEQLAMGGAARR